MSYGMSVIVEETTSFTGDGSRFVKRNYLNQKVESANEPVVTPSVESPPTLNPRKLKCGLQTFFVKENITTKQKYFGVYNVSVHSSMSAAKISVVFPAAMFPDSQIAKGIALERAKMTHTIFYRLGPYFQLQVRNDVSDSDCFAVSFDESLTKITQTQQMALVVRYWSKDKIKVVSRYLGLFKLHQYLDDPVILDISTCGLHSLHNAFKIAVKSAGWNIIAFLRAIHDVFKNTPSRRIHWLQNIEVANRAQNIVNHFQECVKVATREKKEPVSASYHLMCLEDKMLGPRLAFFKVLASEVEQYLTAFQSEKPMALFLYGDLLLLVSNIVSRFVKKNKSAIRRVVDSNPKEIFLFKRDCLKCLQAFCNKMLNRSRLTFTLTRGLSFCDRNVISKKRRNYFKETERICADRVKQNSKSLCLNTIFIEKMNNTQEKHD
ncbi:hypothetical protein PR048_009716 [Dryococelus australis]|uniref:Uncharacterized protein n=1 Tax=Dryococelus australis TaxID=614101 RepID=A0ABQ9I0Q8_9NEOP|nr:hypothetical protein PR048_009716 [Dryococelus australis]